MDTLPTLKELEEATADLALQLERQDRYDGNNPNKIVTAVREARERVTRLTVALKHAGLLERTTHEQLEARLDAAHPAARHRDIVTFERERYQRFVEPATWTLSGGVSTFSRGWRLLAPPAPKNGPDFD
ncbi:hypothetical protein [Caulobacter segnis]